MQLKYHTVYKTTNLVNGKIYIGVHSTNDENDSYLGSGKKIQNAIKKYGRHNFKKEILYVFDSAEEAYLTERQIVNSDFIKSNENYNVSIGGYGTGPGELANVFGHKWTLSEITKEKIRQSKLGEKNPMYGGLSDAHKGKLKLVMREKASRGKDHPNFGKKLTDAEREALRISSSIAYANRKNQQCIYCGAEMKPNLIARYHNGNCKKLQNS